jgi:hypothetical protein
MVDELYDRQYRDGRHELNKFLARVAKGLGDTLAALHRIEYSAPWLEGTGRARDH